MKIVMKDSFLKLMFNIQKKLHQLHNYLPFLHERMKTEKVEKLVADLHDKKIHYTHSNVNKTSIKLRISVEKKMHRVIKFNQKAWRRKK